MRSGMGLSSQGISRGNIFLICIKNELRCPRMLATRKISVSRGMDIMFTYTRHWLEYDSVAFLVLLIGIGLVEFIVWSF
jgi:hypothetical protein